MSRPPEYARTTLLTLDDAEQARLSGLAARVVVGRTGARRVPARLVLWVIVLPADVTDARGLF